MSLIGEYVNNMQPEHAKVRMNEVVNRLDEIWFAWMGPIGGSEGFYFRIHSPVVLIEFDHLAGAEETPIDIPSRDQHIHSLIRTPNGNDYGRDLLREHYVQYANDPMHGH